MVETSFATVVISFVTPGLSAQASRDVQMGPEGVVSVTVVARRAP
jgi:hypothetical protein